MSMEPVICILQQELLLIFFKYFVAVLPVICTATSLLPGKSLSVSSKIPRKSISVYSFKVSISPGQLILISSSISISSFNKHLTFKIFSEHIVSYKPTRKRTPLICLYWPKGPSEGSL